MGDKHDLLDKNVVLIIDTARFRQESVFIELINRNTIETFVGDKTDRTAVEFIRIDLDEGERRIPLAEPDLI